MQEGDGNGWVQLHDGSYRWGLYGAAGLLLHSTDTGGTRHVLLQHRAAWTHMGDTWGIPGGARNLDETPLEAAVREFREEVAGDLSEYTLLDTHEHDLSLWRYDTFLLDLPAMVPFRAGNSESTEIRWVPVEQAEALPLMPAFRSAWRELRAGLDRPPVDGALPGAGTS